MLKMESRRINKRCMRCGKWDDRTQAGYVYCSECAKIEAECIEYRIRVSEAKEKKPQEAVDKPRKKALPKAQKVADSQERKAQREIQHKGDMKEWREQLKQHQLCVSCKQQDAYTLGGRTLCFDCTQKRREWSAKYRAEHREQIREYSRERRKRLVEQHRCAKCGRELPTGEKHKECGRCRAKRRKQTEGLRDRKNPNRIRRGTPGICYLCNKRPVLDGHKLCAECYPKMVKVGMKMTAAAAAKIKEHKWYRASLKV